MRILQKPGKFEILKFDVDVELIEKISRICTNSENKMSNDSYKFITSRIKEEHYSILEHSNITVVFREVSIGMSRESNRHRHLSPTERSTRYCNPSKDGNYTVIMPYDMDIDKKYLLENGEEVSVRDFLNTQRMLYNTLISEGIKREDARQILPLGLETNVVYSGNARVWREVLQKRLTQFAHWEIRGVMNGLLKEFKRRAPAVFSDIEEIEDVFIQTNDIYNIKDCSIINKKYVEKILTPVISSMIKGLGYNADNHELYAMFNTGRIYAYEDIPEHVLPFILGSESVGKEFNNIIKSDTTIKYREIV